MSEPIVFLGESFVLPDRINVRRLTRFVRLASAGDDSTDPRINPKIMGEVDALIDQCLTPEDLARFDVLCDEKRPDFEELMEFVAQVFQALTDRPTSRPSDSSDGPIIIGPNSTDDSSSRVIHRLESKGRPDLALIVLQAQEAKAG